MRWRCSCASSSRGGGASSKEASSVTISPSSTAGKAIAQRLHCSSTRTISTSLATSFSGSASGCWSVARLGLERLGTDPAQRDPRKSDQCPPLLSAVHRSLGASTAVFGALGILTGYGIIAAFLSPKSAPWARAILPIAGGFALLGWFGLGGPEVDIMAHIYGFACGIPLGFVSGWMRILRGEQPTPRMHIPKASVGSRQIDSAFCRLEKQKVALPARRRDSLLRAHLPASYNSAEPARGGRGAKDRGRGARRPAPACARDPRCRRAPPRGGEIIYDHEGAGASSPPPR